MIGCDTGLERKDWRKNRRLRVTAVPEPSNLIRYFLNGSCSTTVPVLSQRLCLYVPMFCIITGVPDGIGFKGFVTWSLLLGTVGAT